MGNNFEGEKHIESKAGNGGTLTQDSMDRDRWISVCPRLAWSTLKSSRTPREIETPLQHFSSHTQNEKRKRERKKAKRLTNTRSTENHGK